MFLNDGSSWNVCWSCKDLALSAENPCNLHCDDFTIGTDPNTTIDQICGVLWVNIAQAWSSTYWMVVSKVSQYEIKDRISEQLCRWEKMSCHYGHSCLDITECCQHQSDWTTLIIFTNKNTNRFLSEMSHSQKWTHPLLADHWRCSIVVLNHCTAMSVVRKRGKYLHSSSYNSHILELFRTNISV